MDFWKTMGVLLRRWYVAVPVFLISVGLAVGVFMTVHTQYESTGTIVLTAPTAGAVTSTDPSKAVGPGNPLLDFEGSLTTTSQLLTQSLSSPTVAKQIAAEGGVDSYQAGDGLTGGPFIVIIADATSPQQAGRTVALALKYAEDELTSRQKTLNAPSATYIGTQSVVSPTPATTKIGGKVRAGGVALVLGLVLSLAAAFGIESMMINRRRRAEDLAEDEDVDERDEDAGDDRESEDEEDDRFAVTKKMRPAPMPRPMPMPAPMPARSGGGPRPMQRPQSPVTQGGDRPTSVIGGGAIKGAGVGGGAVNGAGVGAGANGAAANGGGSGGNNGGANNGGGPRRDVHNAPVPVHKPHPAKPRTFPAPANNNNHDWPRADFRPTDSSTG
jgi:hypothetical protein